jgi:molybdate/tungstate transport system substrate-binding protein
MFLRSILTAIIFEDSATMNRAYVFLVVGLLVGAALGFGITEVATVSSSTTSVTTTAPVTTVTATTTVVSTSTVTAAATVNSQPFAIGAAGTLKFAFGQILNDSFEPTYPGLNVAPPLFQGSGAVAQQEVLTKQFSVEAAADTTTIPHTLPANLSNYEIAFGATSMVIIVNLNNPQGQQAYSLWQGAQNLAPLSAQSNQTWRQIFGIIANSSAVVGVSNPFTDPSGYQAMCMSKLVGMTLFGSQNVVYSAIYNNTAKFIQRDTETDLLTLMNSGQLGFIISGYLSNAIPQTKEYSHLAYMTMPPQFNLGSINYVNLYHTISFKVTEQGVTKSFTCNPVLYTVTIPLAAPNPQAAALFVATIFSPSAQQILISNGITPILPGLVHGNYAAIPDSVKPFVTTSLGNYSAIFPSS